MEKIIKSKDVRDYLKKIDHKFTDRELATLVYNCKMDMSEKHEKLLGICKHTDDQILKKQIIQSILWELKCMNAITNNSGNYVYRSEIWDEDRQREQEEFFTSFELAKEFAIQYKKYCKISKLKLFNVSKKKEENEEDSCVADVYYDEQGQLDDFWTSEVDGDFRDEKGRYENAYVEIPIPFCEGDIIRVIGTDEVGIVREFPNRESKEEKEERIKKLIADGRLDYSEICITVEMLYGKSGFGHDHISPFDLEYANLEDSDPRKPILEMASCLVNGQCYIQEFQMLCDRSKT